MCLVNTDSMEFIRFIISHVIPKMNPFPQPNSVLVLDNASIHKNGYLKRSLNRHGIKLIFLPPYSPYLNPIELDFNTIKAFVKRNYFIARQRPIYTLHKALYQTVNVNVTTWMRRVGYFDHILDC